MGEDNYWLRWDESLRRLYPDGVPESLAGSMRPRYTAPEPITLADAYDLIEGCRDE